jgi:hypothetical protein
MDIKFKKLKVEPKDLDKGEVVDWDIAQPYPAIDYIPQWFKDQPATNDSPDGDIRTLKLCQPYIDGMTNGYIIPAPHDVTLKVLGKYFIEAYGKGRYWFSLHGEKQYNKSWWKDRGVIKFDSPWIIETPPGYSIKVSHFFGNNVKPLLGIPAIVDTDTYPMAPAFPMIHMDLRVGYDIEFKKGDPLIQITPFKREDWQMSVEDADMEKWEVAQQTFWDDPDNNYLKNFKQKKTYK